MGFEPTQYSKKELVLKLHHLFRVEKYEKETLLYLQYRHPTIIEINIENRMIFAIVKSSYTQLNVYYFI